MAIVNDLMGAGLPDQAAQRLGYTIASVTSAGSGASDATVIKKAQTVCLVTTGGASQGVKLPADAELMQPYIIANLTATAALIYPPTSGQINGDTATSGTVPLTARGTTICYRTGVNAWIAVGGAAG